MDISSEVIRMKSYKDEEFQEQLECSKVAPIFTFEANTIRTSSVKCYFLGS